MGPFKKDETLVHWNMGEFRGPEVGDYLWAIQKKDHIERLEKMRKYADLHGDKRVFLGAVAGVVEMPRIEMLPKTTIDRFLLFLYYRIRLK